MCDQLLATPTSGPVCETCWSTVRRLTPPFCPRCGDPVPAGHGSALPGNIAGAEIARLPMCSRCRDRSSGIATSRAVGEYSGALREIVHLLKYAKHRSLAPRLATLMIVAGVDVLTGADAAVPVPLHWRRRWRRGFNQATLLASGLAIPVWPALSRVRSTRPQVGLTAAARRVNVRDAFAIARKRWPWQRSWGTRLQGKVVVLIDDVSTTATTLETCARVLRDAGVREVRALTAARVVDLPR